MIGARRSGAGGRRYQLLTGTFLALTIAFVLFPFLFTLSTSTKTYEEFLHEAWLPTVPPHLDNYATAFRLVRAYLLNTLLVNVVSVFFGLLFAALTAYVFARHSFPGKDLLFMLVLSLIMVPGILTLLPRFVVVMELGLLNTYWALILPYIAGVQAFNVLVLRTFIAALPEELFEATRMDGASDLQTFIYITIPLSRPILATLAVLQTLRIWDDLVWPMITISDAKLRTIAAGLAYLNDPQQTLFGAVFASYTLAAVPLILLFVVSMRQFTAGLTSGALKI